MSDYSSLKTTINANVKANNNQEITGSIMNSVLNAMVNSLGAGYQYIGVATPTNPGSAQTPDYRCFYIATTPGTYTNLGGLVVADGEVAILKYDTSWTKEVTGIATAESVSQLGQYSAKPLGTFSGALRQGTKTNLRNTQSVCYLNIAPRINANSIKVFTTKPAPENCKWQWRFETFAVSSGLTFSTNDVRSIAASDNNSLSFNNGELGYCVTIACYNLSTSAYEPLSLADFDGYEIYTINDIGLLLGVIDNQSDVKGAIESINAANEIRGKVFSIIGDSISSFVGTDIGNSYYPTENSPADVNSVYATWWEKMIMTANAQLGVNASFGGARVTNTRPAQPAYTFFDRVSMIDDNGTPDLIFVALGTNDSFDNVSVGTFDYDAEMSSYDESLFAPAYIKGVRSLLESYPNAKIILISFVMAQKYQNAIRDIANHYGLTYINIQDYTTCSDGFAVHPDNAGMNLIAERLMKYKIYESLSSLDSRVSSLEVPKPVLSFEDNFDNLSSKMIEGDLPLFSPVNGFLKDPSIWFHNGKWYMYCTTSTEGTTNFDTDWYSSTDGKTWKYEKRVFEHTGVNGYARYCQAATSKAVLINGVWHIWVTCWGTTNGWCIAHYTCADIENPEWIADENNPIVTNANGHVLDPFIVLEDGTYYMFYTHDTTEQIAYRTSADGVTWSNETDIANVFGEGPMVMKAANGKWLIMCARAGGNSLRNEDLDVFESEQLTSGYTYIGKPNMQLPAWANVCYGHGDLLEIPAGYFGYPKKKYLLYYQATWNFGANMVIGTAMSDDGYNWYPYNFGKYGWGDFFQIDNAGYLIIRKQNTLPNWKPFVRTYDYWRDFEISVRVTQIGSPTSKAAGLVFFGENAQYLNCLVVEYDMENQLLVAKLLPKNNVGDAKTYLSLPAPFIVAGAHLLLKVERKGTTIGVTAFKSDDVQQGETHYFEFNVSGFERLAFGLISENSEAYFNEINLRYGTK